MSGHPIYTDSRDVEERIEELEAIQQAHDDARADVDEARAEYEAEPTDDNEQRLAEASAALESTDPLDADDAQELAELIAFRDELDGGDWKYGTQLVLDSDFEEHARELARELAEDCGDLPRDATNRWPFTCINWTHAAKELQQDYTSAELDGRTYWCRS